MKILLYTQARWPVGSLRMLLNLARHLQQFHQVYLAFGRGHAGEKLLQSFTDIAVIDCTEAADVASRCDVLLCHLPRRPDPIVNVAVPRKLAICMEVASVHNLLINNENMHLFDALLYLHSEQIAHLDQSTRDSKCVAMPIINNISSLPPYNKSENIGCIGTRQKHDITVLLKILRQTDAHRKMKLWSPQAVELENKITNTFDRIRLAYYRYQGRWCEMGVDADVMAIVQQYDLLLHTPAWSNGTSTVVSDALASGKMVLLPPLPAFKQAYQQHAGVFFLDNKNIDVENMLLNYSQDKYEHIHRSYAAVYNRVTVLQQWQNVIEGNS